MKVLIACVLVAVAQAAVISHSNPGGGTSQQYRSQDGAGHYSFGYDESHATGGSFRRESGGAGAVVGTYGLRVADGRQRVVDYSADAGGFRAHVRSNEPGIAPHAPAAASYNAGDHHPAAYSHYYGADPHYAGYHMH